MIDISSKVLVSSYQTSSTFICRRLFALTLTHLSFYCLLVCRIIIKWYERAGSITNDDDESPDENKQFLGNNKSMREKLHHAKNQTSNINERHTETKEFHVFSIIFSLFSLFAFTIRSFRMFSFFGELWLLLILIFVGNIASDQASESLYSKIVVFGVEKSTHWRFLFQVNVSPFSSPKPRH